MPKKHSHNLFIQAVIIADSKNFEELALMLNGETCIYVLIKAFSSTMNSILIMLLSSNLMMVSAKISFFTHI